MSGMQDKRQQPGKGREEQEHLQRRRPGQNEPKDRQSRPAHERDLQDPTRERERELDDDMRDGVL
ncbi:hypothetical protein [Streptomyces sp. NRRL F-2664]|uniref:hypothetical protein n=1 Tax=Streptomyces sp. NRRL F-2664 TaxID=1463842 RepID=UPI0007C66039|nr:hypothetical protein [Streptomyces sp. NRRL F-2664]